MTICVRMARPEDADSIRQVGDQAFEPVLSLYRPNPAALANLSAMVPALERMVAELDGKVVGTVRFGVIGECLRVIGLAVLPRFQNRGVARSLIHELTGLAISSRCRALALYTVTKTGNVPIFERLGFRLISEEPDEYSISVDGGPLVAAYMERPVACPIAP